MASFDTTSKTQAETMQEPDIIRYWTEQATTEAREQGVQQGLQQGARESALEAILEVLTLQLHPEAADTFKPTLEAIHDLQRLKQLHRAAILADTPEDFTQALEN